MYLDDRSWFCSRQSTCLLIAKASRAEAEKLGLDESKNKAEFAVVLLRLVRSSVANIPGQVVTRPKLLVGCRPCSAKAHLFNALKSIQTQVTRCGSSTEGYLTRLILGHAARLYFQAGKVSALFTLLHSAVDSVIRQAWSGSVCNGPVSLLRKWMQRQGWQERVGGNGHTRLPEFSWLTKVLLKGEINHWLRDAWRGHAWNTWFTGTKSHRAIGRRHWSTVRGAFDALRTLLKKLPPDMLPHAMAVVSGSFCSQAFFDGQHHGQESLCWLLWQ